MEKFKVFTIAFILTLLVIVPVFLLASAFQYANISLPTEGKTESVPIVAPTIGDARNILLIETGKVRSFVLLRFDALSSKISVSAIPNETKVVVDNGETTLDAAYDYAGPALAMSAFCSTYGLKPCDYVALSAENLFTLAGSMLPPNEEFLSGLSGPLAVKTKEWLANYRFYELSPTLAYELINSDAFTLPEKYELCSVIFASYLKINYRSMGGEVLAAFKEISPEMVTNIDAKKINTYSRIFTLLSGARTELYCEPLAGKYDGEILVPTATSLEKLKQMFE